jgi:hypothetical protein
MTTALLVRHADIDLPPLSNDPPLNVAGRRHRLLHRKGADYLNIAQSVTNFAQQVHDPGPVFS